MVPGVAANNAENPFTYRQVPPQLFQEHEVLDCDIYFYYQGNHILFQKASQIWGKADSQKIEDFKIEHLFVRVKSAFELQMFLDRRLKEMIAAPAIPTTQKAKVIYSATISSAQSAFENPHSRENLEQSIAVVSHCVNYLSSDNAAFYELFKESAQNLTEHNHGLHTAAYAIRFGAFLGHKTEREALTLGIGSLLHDIGKTKVRKSVLEKPGVLTEIEMGEVRRHCQYGNEIALKYKDIIPEVSRRMIYEHHEKSDGSGYPRELPGAEIHLFSKILRICDVFDSMTAKRTYKDQTKPFDTIKEMIQITTDESERNLIVRFIEMMKL
jgi:HD-GYP domain-containing protein (c-di-GMP phosphodiesterase class II)